MWILVIISLVVSAASFAYSMYLMRKARSATLADISDASTVPSVEEGKYIPVVFGTRDVKDPVLAWFYAYKETTTVEKFYHIYTHFVVCYGELTALRRVLLDEKPLYTYDPDEGSYYSGAKTLFANQVFQGGSVFGGQILLSPGTSDGAYHNLLPHVTREGQLYPNLVSVCFNDPYIGESNQPRTPTFTIKRIPNSWYPEKAEIKRDSFRISAFYGSQLQDNDEDQFHTGFISDKFTSRTFTELEELTDMTLVSNKPLRLKVVIELGNGGITNGCVLKIRPFGLIVKDGVATYGYQEKTLYKEFVASSAHKISTYIDLSVDFLAIRNADGYIQLGFFVDNKNWGSTQASLTPSVYTPLYEDMNPAHIIYECLTDLKWGLGVNSATYMDEDNFRNAADTLYTEKFGLSIKWNGTSLIEDFITEICRHIDGAVFLDSMTGKFRLKLFRRDYNAGTLILLDPSNVSSIKDFKRLSPNELTNSVTVTYWDTAGGCTGAVTVENNALIAFNAFTASSQIVPLKVDFPGITNRDLATIVALRELSQGSIPVLVVTLTANYDAVDLQLGDCFRLTWPLYQVSDLVMRVTKIVGSDSKSNTITIEAAEDVS